MSAMEALYAAQEAQRRKDRRVPVQLALEDEPLERLGIGDHSSQMRLLAEPCALCGRTDQLLLSHGELMACVECITKENGEDGCR